MLPVPCPREGLRPPAAVHSLPARPLHFTPRAASPRGEGSLRGLGREGLFKGASQKWTPQRDSLLGVWRILTSARRLGCKALSLRLAGSVVSRFVARRPEVGSSWHQEFPIMFLTQPNLYLYFESALPVFCILFSKCSWSGKPREASCSVSEAKDLSSIMLQSQTTGPLWTGGFFLPRGLTSKPTGFRWEEDMLTWKKQELCVCLPQQHPMSTQACC